MAIQDRSNKPETVLHTIGDDFRWREAHEHVLLVVREHDDPSNRQDIAEGLWNGVAMGVHYSNDAMAGLGRWLNDLTRNGYLQRFKSGYVLTPKGNLEVTRG